MFKACHLSCDFRMRKGIGEEFKTSPYRRYKNDLEAGTSSREIDEEEDEGSGPFDIVRTKSAPLDRLRRWRVSLLALLICFSFFTDF